MAAKGNGKTAASAEPPAAGTVIEQETINDRIVLHYADRPSVYADTGDEYDAEEAKAVSILLPPPGPSFGGTIQNAPIYYWMPESIDKDTKRPEPNPIRGFVLAIFRRPAWMKGTEDEKGEEQKALVEGEEQKAPRLRLAAWILTTCPVLARNRDKEIEVIPPGRVVWVDVNQAIGNLPLRAMPKPNPAGGDPLEIYEVAIDPRYKKQIGNGPDGKPRQAWRMDLYGGRGATKDGYRTFGGQQIEAIRGMIRIPEVGQYEAEDFPELGAPTMPRALPATANGAPALPAAGAAN